MTPEQLKASILQLAIQGKLVEQIPEEGTAEDLYQQIQDKKAKLIKEGKIKKEKPLPPIDEDEIPFDIPNSWKWARLSSLVSVLGDGLHGTPSYDFNGAVYFINGNNLRNGKIVISDSTKRVSKEEAKKYYKELNQSSLLVSINGTLGNVAFYNNEPVILGKSACYFNLISNLNKYFFKVLIDSDYFQRYLTNFATGTTIKNVPLAAMRSVLIPLPPLAEQKRIVAKIEELLPLVEKYKKAYSELEILNSKFSGDMKKSILQYAIQGKLVEQRPEEGTAEDLYQQIQEEKANLIKEGKLKKEKPLSPIDEDEIPFDIPDSWRWIRVVDLIQVLNGDRGKNYPSKDKLKEKGIPFVSASNLDGKTVVKDSNLKCLSEEQYSLLRAGKLQKDDILVCIRGSLGKCATYPFDKGAIASSLIICRPYIQNKSEITDYVMNYLKSNLFYSEISKYDNGTAQPNLAAKDFCKFLLPLPPLAEQKRIVAKVEELLALCDKLKLK